jgi:GNAT superfamily N-acetyltransferase
MSRAEFATINWDALPGEETLIECWEALTQLSPAARMINTSAATAAVFPSWAPLNNAILQIAPDDRKAEDAVSQLIACYTEAGVATWALWVRSDITNLDAPDIGPEISDLKRDTTTLVMHATLSSGRQRHGNVVRTSIATATRAGDQPVRRADLEPPDDIPGLTGWVMLHENVAVASAWSFLNGRDCGIYTVGTQQEWRRRGFARALMEHVLGDAWRRGARTASLQSTRMGEPLYISLGFQAAGRYEEWLCGDPVAASEPITSR